jgi:hypothetical protein
MLFKLYKSTSHGPNLLILQMLLGGDGVGVVHLKWAWFIKSGRGRVKISRASRAIVLQPPHTKFPRSAPAQELYNSKHMDMSPTRRDCITYTVPCIP